MAATGEWTLGLIDSAWFGSEYEGQPGREEARRIGYDTLDLFIGFDPGAMPADELQAYVAGARSVGLPIISLVCASFGLNEFNPAVRDYHIARSKRIVDLAAAIPSVRNLCFAPGEYMFSQKLLPPADEWARTISATREVGEYAAERNVELAIELLPFPFAFVNSMDALVRFLDDVALDNVKATVDVSHLWLTRTPFGALERLNGRIAHVHVSDCDGVNHGDRPPGHGNTPFPDYLAAIRDTGFAGTASVELEFPPEPDAVLPWVEESFETTSRLLADVGVRRLT